MHKMTKMSHINSGDILHPLLLFLQIKSPIWLPVVFMYAIKNAKQTKIDLSITTAAILDYSCVNCKYLLGELLLDYSHQGTVTGKKRKNKQGIYSSSAEKKITIPAPKQKVF